MTKILLLHNTHNHDMTIINAIQDPTDHLTSNHIDLLIDVILVPDIDHVHIQETITFSDVLHLSDHLQDRDTPDPLDHGHIHILETSSTQYHHKHTMIHLTSKYACITPQNWLML